MIAPRVVKFNESSDFIFQWPAPLHWVWFIWQKKDWIPHQVRNDDQIKSLLRWHQCAVLSSPLLFLNQITYCGRHFFRDTLLCLSVFYCLGKHQLYGKHKTIYQYPLRIIKHNGILVNCFTSKGNRQPIWSQQITDHVYENQCRKGHYCWFCFGLPS